jgi:hemoglobin-like flavoprotein
VTPGQIAIVETTMAMIDEEALAADFYRLAFAADPALARMFSTEPERQRARFAAELGTIVGIIRTHDRFLSRTRELGARHHAYGVRTAHYHLMGEALLEALRRALGAEWTEDVEEAWRSAYDLTAEAMLIGARSAAVRV